MSSYTHCPACSHPGRRGTDTPGVFTCRRCGALYGDCYKGDSYRLVLPVFTTEAVPPEQCRYYDLTVLGSDGVTRRHGWYDVATRLIAQVG